MRCLIVCLVLLLAALPAGGEEIEIFIEGGGPVLLRRYCMMTATQKKYTAEEYEKFPEGAPSMNGRTKAAAAGLLAAAVLSAGAVSATAQSGS